MSYKKIFFLIITVFSAITTLADGVSFTAQAKNTVAVGERFNLTYTVNANGTRFRGPQINEFNILSGPNQSTSSNMQFINGQMTQSMTLSFSYILQAQREGTFTIPSATINVNGVDYQSNTVTVNVVAGTAPQQQQRNQQQQQQQQQNAKANAEEIFLRAHVDKTNPVQGEQVIVTYKLYTSLAVSQYTIDRLASFSGFWSETLTKDNERPKQYNEVVNGVNYTVAEIRKIALFPQRSGTLTVEPLDVECIVQKRVQRQRQNIFDDFFFNPFFEGVQNVKVNVKSNAITLNVSPLPTQNRTADFGGSVGNFKFEVTTDKTDLAVNDAVTLKVKISGSGNIKMLEEPKIIFPPNLEAYDPKINDNINRTASGISGNRTFEYLLIPRAAGTFEIQPIVFSFYNISAKKYETLYSESIILNVAKGEGSVHNGVAVNAVSREDVQYIGSDIRYIKSNIFPLTPIGRIFFQSSLFNFLILLPIILFILFVIIWHRHIQLSSNAALVKNRKATKMARKRLKKAQEHLKNNNQEAYYDEVSRALWGYFNYKFNVSYAELSKDIIEKVLSEKKVDNSIAVSFIKTLDDCEFARFAPGNKQEIMESIFNDALELITKIEKALK